MRRLEMDQMKEIIRLRYSTELSQRQIAEAVGCSLGTVSNVLKRAEDAGIKSATQLCSKELGTLLYPPVKKSDSSETAEPDLEYIDQQMKRKGVTLMLLWEEYKNKHPDGLMYTQFCTRYRQFRKQNGVYLRKIYKAGEQLMVDWAGLTMNYWEAGEEKKAFIFVANLPASSYMYAEPFRNQGMESWISAHVHAFEYFGGTPEILVPDNAKTAVITPDLYDPKLNKTYRELASHYNMVIIPARASRPRDKAPVENGVEIVERRIIAKLRDTLFLSFEELRSAVFQELKAVNTAKFQKSFSSRIESFQQLEKPLLSPLPADRYEFAEWKIVKVGFDYHVFWRDHNYSVPYTFAGKMVEIRSTAKTIEVFLDLERIAIHPRSYDKTQRYITNPDHMPENHRAVTDWSPERFLSWAAKTGPKTTEFIKFIIDHRDHPAQAYKTCAGILRMAEKITPGEMELICSEAKRKDIYSFKYFQAFFKHYQTSGQLEEMPPAANPNIRGSSYYGGQPHVG